MLLLRWVEPRLVVEVSLPMDAPTAASVTPPSWGGGDDKTGRTSYVRRALVGIFSRLTLVRSTGWIRSSPA